MKRKMRSKFVNNSGLIIARVSNCEVIGLR